MEYLYAVAFIVAASVIPYAILASRPDFHPGFRLACLFVFVVGVLVVVEELATKDWKPW